mmetsp:Transcript_165194/g.530190  ORF Transcript_165194/g.530190 Transcript_165194/m.530190 type:complete len:332 (+) Transcript_165194:672-1667(+)
MARARSVTQSGSHACENPLVAVKVRVQVHAPEVQGGDVDRAVAHTRGILGHEAHSIVHAALHTFGPGAQANALDVAVSVPEVVKGLHRGTHLAQKLEIIGLIVHLPHRPREQRGLPTAATAAAASVNLVRDVTGAGVLRGHHESQLFLGQVWNEVSHADRRLVRVPRPEAALVAGVRGKHTIGEARHEPPIVHQGLQRLDCNPLHVRRELSTILRLEDRRQISVPAADRFLEGMFHSGAVVQQRQHSGLPLRHRGYRDEGDNLTSCRHGQSARLRQQGVAVRRDVGRPVDGLHAPIQEAERRQVQLALGKLASREARRVFVSGRQGESHKV